MVFLQRNCEKKDGNQWGKINALKWIKNPMGIRTM
jgi:hypothetical protein